ncbi:unnamed protein product [Bemisia tabaci]|uniref:Transmembrane protein n=1 Tax=Bemisia tabaci TaxID=7038 RepID=A0A9P0EXZ9_BEMTA|nr:unnamed protein product [Bemisia tabaci]
MMCDGNKVFIMSLLLIGLCSLSQAEESAAVSAGRQPDNPSNQEPSAVEKEIVAPAFPRLSAGDFSMSGMSTTALVGVAVAFAAGFFLLSTAWPLLNIRACAIFGTCGPDYNAYSSVGTPYNNDAYTYSAQPPYTSTSYQKRSISRRRRALQ